MTKYSDQKQLDQAKRIMGVLVNTEAA